MHIVPEAMQLPRHCAITGQHRSQRGFIDTGNMLRGNSYIYLSVEGVESAGRLIGMTTEAETHDRDVKIRELEAKVAELEAVAEEYDRFRQSVEYSFNHAGKQLQNKPGIKASV